MSTWAALIKSTGDRSGWPWVIVLAASLLLSFVHRGLLGILVTPIQHDLLLSDLQMGEIQGPAFAIVFAVTSVVFGRIADTWRRRELLVLGMVLWSCGTLVCGFAQGFGSLVLGRMLIGSGIATVIPLGVAIIGDAFEPQRRGLAYGVFMAGAPLGDALTVITGGELLSLAQKTAIPWISGLAAWRQVVLVSVGPVLPLIILTMCLSEPSRRTDASAAELEDHGDESPRYLVRNWRIYLPYALSTALCAICGAATYWMPEVLRRSFSLGADTIGEDYGITLLVSSIAGAGAGVMAGRLAVTAQQGFGLASLTYVVVALSLLTFLSTSFGLTLGSIGLYVVADAATAVLLTSSIQSITPGSLRGTVAALERFCGAIVGYSLGQPLVGYISDHWMRGARGLGIAMVTVVIPALLIAAIFLYLAGRPLTERQPAAA
jgi:MFS family permease